jgi:hypothetical protein
MASEGVLVDMICRNAEFNVVENTVSDPVTAGFALNHPTSFISSGVKDSLYGGRSLPRSSCFEANHDTNILGKLDCLLDILEREPHGRAPSYNAPRCRGG